MSVAMHWRQLTDQLTAEQVALLAAMENGSADYLDKGGLLLEIAQNYIEGNARDAVLFGHLDPPAGAVAVYPSGEREGGCWSREFVGAERKVGGVTVHLDGEQYTDGTIERRLSLSVDEFTGEGDLTATEARRLAAALMDAADDLEALP